MNAIGKMNIGRTAGLVLYVWLVVMVAILEATPAVFYANIGDTAQLQCSGGGGMVCFSTYADRTTAFAMVALTPSYKYQIQSGYVAVTNVQATDAGFYTCSARCDQVTYDQIAYYLHPTMSGVPIDTNQNWIAIPPNAWDSNNRQRYYVVVSDEGSGLINGHASGLSVGEIVGLVVGVALAVLITLAIIIVLCILNKRRKKRNQEKSVDYSTIERDYGSSSAGNTLTSSRDHNNQLADRDGEMHSLSANKSRANNEINTRGMSGPTTYRPNEYSTGGAAGGSSRQVLDLPNIDIGGSSSLYAPDNKKTSSNRSQGGQGPRVQFPDRPNIDNRQRYISSNENIHLQQIVQESGLNMLEDDYERNNHPYQFNNQNLALDDQDTDGGGVTVVSARTPARLDQPYSQQPSGKPPQVPVATTITAPTPKYINQSQPPPPKQYPGLSLSHRIETTSTPLQIPLSSSSVRNGGGGQLPYATSGSTPLRQASLSKDGATDV